MLHRAVRWLTWLHDVRNTRKVRPHVVNFMDQMLRSEGALRVEELVLPAGMAPVALGRLLPASRAYMLMAAHQDDHWTFHPPEDLPVGGGMTLVLMADPDGRAFAEEQIRKYS